MNYLAQNLSIPNPQGTPQILQGPIGDMSLFGGTLTIGSILTRAIPFIFAFAGLGLLLMIIAGGFALLTSGGDSKKLDQGKQTITNAILGFVIIFTAYWIVQIVGYIFGLKDITTMFKI